MVLGVPILKQFRVASVSNHRRLKFYQSNRKKEALRMLVSIYNIQSTLYIVY